MSERIRGTISPQPRIETTGIKQPRLDVAQVAAALGGETIPAQLDAASNPLIFYALRAELFRRRHSQGGRPRIEGTSQRVKIPLSDQDWTALEKLAVGMASSGFSPSPGQIASVLLHAAIQSIQQPKDTKETDDKLVQAIASQLVAASSEAHT